MAQCDGAHFSPARDDVGGVGLQLQRQAAAGGGIRQLGELEPGDGWRE